MRSFIFTKLFYLISTIFVLMAVLVAYLPWRTPLMSVMFVYTHLIRVLMRLVMGIKVEVRGRENLPKDGTFIIAAKHQSYADGIVMFSLFYDLSFVTSQHLTKYPFLGKILLKFGAVVVNGAGGNAALTSFKLGIKRLVEQDRKVLIYPEGKLTEIGTYSRYRKGVYHLYETMECPIVLVATNVGMLWPQNLPKKYSGTAVIEFLPAVEQGLNKAEFMAHIENQIEGRSYELLPETGKAKFIHGYMPHPRDVTTPLPSSKQI